jgi:Gas vesicle synthesis protein GvpL/GvpF
MSAAPIRESGTGWYLYGVVPAGVEAPAARAVDASHEVVAIETGGIAGVASQVSLDEFDERALPERLGDAEWLERKIRAHEQVLEAVLARTVVVPCRFCTVYRDEDDLKAFLAAHATTLTEALDRLAGRVELGVKAFAAPQPGSEARQAESGRAYLEARRDDQRRREELAASRSRLAAELNAQLLSAAEDGVALDLQSREASGRDEEMLFNGAYLVSDRGPFEQALGSFSREHGELQLELTGPWPPYNFVPEELGRG